MMMRLVLCLLACCSPLSGQSSAYRTQWTKSYPAKQWCGHIAVGENGDLWIVCPTSDGLGLRWESRVLHINADGRTLSAQEIGFTLPEPPGALVGRIPDCPPQFGIDEIAVAVNNGRIGIAAAVTQYLNNNTLSFAGAYFTSIDDGRAGAPVYIAHETRFPKLVAHPDGGFIATGDPAPLIVIKLETGGKVLWKRELSYKLTLPRIAVTAQGDVLMVAQGNRSLTVARLNSQGVMLRQRRIGALQGTIAAGTGGQIAVIYNERIDGPVFLTALDGKLRRLWTVELPMTAIDGRSYQLVAAADGYAAIGRNGRDKATLVEIDQAGKIVAQAPTQYKPGLTLHAAPHGYYMVESGPTGIEVTRMVADSPGVHQSSHLAFLSLLAAEPQFSAIEVGGVQIAPGMTKEAVLESAQKQGLAVRVLGSEITLRHAQKSVKASVFLTDNGIVESASNEIHAFSSSDVKRLFQGLLDLLRDKEVSIISNGSGCPQGIAIQSSAGEYCLTRSTDAKVRLSKAASAKALAVCRSHDAGVLFQELSARLKPGGKGTISKSEMLAVDVRVARISIYSDGRTYALSRTGNGKISFLEGTRFTRNSH